jgi:hypothetical protein
MVEFAKFQNIFGVDQILKVVITKVNKFQRKVLNQFCELDFLSIEISAEYIQSRRQFIKLWRSVFRWLATVLI